MLKRVWQRKQWKVAAETKALCADLTKTEKLIDQYVERIVETSVPAVVRALEEKVQKLEN